MTSGQADNEGAANSVQAFAVKLDAFAQTLTGEERALLDPLMQRAAVAEGDAQGYAWTNQGIIIVSGQPSPLLFQALNFNAAQFTRYR